MKNFALTAMAVATMALAAPVHADEIADLKAEIAAQKQAAAAQKARLDALEQRLNGVQQQAAAKPAPAPDAAAASSGYTQGQGLSMTAAGTSVNVYGLIDVSYLHVNNADAKGNTLNGPRVAWFSGNRWGILGKRPMGDSGLNVIFNLEAEYESQTGNDDTPGTTFNRAAWVGVESKDFGRLKLGRQNAIGRDPIASAIYSDPYSSASPTLDDGGYTNTNNFKQLVYYAGSATGTRINNGVVWKKAFDGGLYVAAEYQFSGAAGDFNTGTTKSVAVSYAGGAFNLGSFATTANVAGLTNNSYSVGGNYTAGIVRVNAGVFHYTAEQGALGGRSDNAYTVSTKIAPVGHMSYELGYQVMKASNAAVNSGGNVLNAFANASTAKAVATGSRSTLYGSVFYHWDKITEVYFAADYLKLNEGYKVAVTNGASSQTELALGLRTRF